MDGIPISTADGGSNSLGGAINFVMPTGRDASPFEARFDAGSFGYLKTQTSTGGAYGRADYSITTSAQREDGYRKHSKTDSERLNANFGYQFSPDAETRFYINADRWRAQLPGEVTKAAALTSPQTANAGFVLQNQQRNIDSVRLANKTTLRFDNTMVDFGIFGLDRDVMHPIYQYLDFTAMDYGGFVRATDDHLIGGIRTVFIGAARRGLRHR